MKKASIILFNIKNINKDLIKDTFIVGCDRGALNCASNDIFMDLAVGDFDSVDEVEFELIKKYSKKIIKLNPIKDSTDTQYAIDYLKDYDEITIYGGIKGKRIEHFYANMIDLYNNKKLRMMDDNSLIITSEDSFNPLTNYKFISIFSLSNDTIISLKGFKYELDDYNLLMNNPLGISNEVSNNPLISIKKGRILVIYSNDDKR